MNDAAEGTPIRDEDLLPAASSHPRPRRPLASSLLPFERTAPLVRQFLKCIRIRLERRGFAGRLPWFARFVRRRGLAIVRSLPRSLVDRRRAWRVS